MIINSSYACEIKHLNNIFKPTIKLFNKAISFCINVFNKEWDYLKEFDSFIRKAEAEYLIHSTKDYTAKYSDFDKLFYKMPSYMRRAVINFSLGYLSSYYSNLGLWEDKGCIGRKPILQKNHNQFPAFYKDNMYNPNPIKDDCVLLKLFVNNDWVWVKVNLEHTDLQYIRKHLSKAKMSVPTLEHKNKKWFLRFCFTENVPLNKTKLKEQKVLAVDLGLNNDAVCSIMKKDGTILKRKFINFKSDKD